MSHMIWAWWARSKRRCHKQRWELR